MRRYEQDKEREHFPQGAYLDVRDQGKAHRDKVLRSIYVFLRAYAVNIAGEHGSFTHVLRAEKVHG